MLNNCLYKLVVLSYIKHTTVLHWIFIFHMLHLHLFYEGVGYILCTMLGGQKIELSMYKLCRPIC